VQQIAAKFANRSRVLLDGLSGVGLVLGTLFLAASLTPTLIPRSYETQGALAGVCMAIGYGVGVALRWLWRYLEIPEPGARLRRASKLIAAAACLCVVVLFLHWSAGWQDSIRAVMGMEPVESMRPFRVCAIAALTFALLLVIARLFGWVASRVSRLVGRYLPRRVANVAGVAIAVFLFFLLGNDVFVRGVFHLLDASYRQYDSLLEPDRPQPVEPGKTGSPASLVKWDELGRAGRQFIATGPRAGEIAEMTGRSALEPIRVYVGLGSGDDVKARAGLALEELKRVGGFDRSLLVIITPTGTGWVDPAALDSLEYLQDGDVASVAAQYSYLSSPLSLLAQPEYGAESARALFLAIYGYWTTLPKDRRPRLYLHGLSLGAMNSEKSVSLFEIIEDPVDGALWSGPPFETRMWRTITDARNPGSPEWLPEFRDGRLVRFMNQDGFSVPADRPWGPIRVVYLQHASDPIVFFDYRDLYRPPAWMEMPRGPDVSPELRWYPVVTMLQLALDMAVATSTPIGHGHVYAPADYIDGWVAVTEVKNWTPERLDALKRFLGSRAAAVHLVPGGTDEHRGG